MKEQRVMGIAPVPITPRTISSGATRLKVLSGANHAPVPDSPRIVAAAPQPSRHHMRHHKGMIGMESTNSEVHEGDSPFKYNIVRHEELVPSPHPYLSPSQRYHGNVLDAGIEDRLPPRASRAPALTTSVKSHSSHFLSWPGTALFVPASKHHYRPTNDCTATVRGDLPIMQSLLNGAGSRPDFPIFGAAA